MSASRWVALALCLFACDGTGTVKKPGPDGFDLGDSGSDVDTDDSPTQPPAPDLDKDGYGADVDCDDANPLVHPGAVEACNGADDDCDDQVDMDTEAFDGATGPVYTDADVDGYGLPSSARWICDGLIAGQVMQGGDCDDTNPNIRPGAVEVCDGIDNDCDSLVDSADASLDATGHPDAVQGYPDGDGDGSPSSVPRWACQAPVPPWPTTPGSDCLDDDPLTFAGAAQVESGVLCMRDADDDGYGDDDPPDGVVAGTDCDDARADVNPGEEEVPYDGVVSDCAPYSDDDADRDGHDAQTRGGDDCDDMDDAIHPGATDIPIDGIDQDCSGQDAPCVLGDFEQCPATSCRSLQSQRPGIGNGLYWIRPSGVSSPYEVRCDTGHDGGGWTLVAVVADDSQYTWTWNARARWSSSSSSYDVGSPDRMDRDLRSPAMHHLSFTDLLFVHRPSNVWAGYYDLTTNRTLVSWISGISGSSTGICYADYAGWPKDAGTLGLGGTLCDTKLYISPQDQDGQDDQCHYSSSTGNYNWDDTYGPAWSSGNTSTSSCPMDDPGLRSSLGPNEYNGGLEKNALGFAGPRGLNSGASGTGQNRMEIYVR